MTEAKQHSIPDQLYEELHAQHFGSGGSADQYFHSDGMEEQRRVDIEDTFTKTREIVAELFPEIESTDPERIDRATSLMAFFERCGFEDGIAFMAQNRPTSPIDADRVLARQHIYAV